MCGNKRAKRNYYFVTNDLVWTFKFNEAPCLVEILWFNRFSNKTDWRTWRYLRQFKTERHCGVCGSYPRDGCNVCSQLTLNIIVWQLRRKVGVVKPQFGYIFRPYQSGTEHILITTYRLLLWATTAPMLQIILSYPSDHSKRNPLINNLQKERKINAKLLDLFNYDLRKKAANLSKRNCSSTKIMYMVAVF